MDILRHVIRSYQRPIIYQNHFIDGKNKNGYFTVKNMIEAFSNMKSFFWNWIKIPKRLTNGRQPYLNPVRNLRPRKGGGGSTNIRDSVQNTSNAAFARDGGRGFLHQVRPFVSSTFRRIINTSRCGNRNREIFKYKETAGPLFALVGVTLMGIENDDELDAPNRKLKGFITRQDEIEAICEDIREAVQRCQYVKNIDSDNSEYGLGREISENHAYSLKDLELSDVIDKGCNAVVYAAKWKDSAGNIDKTTTEVNGKESECENIIGSSQMDKKSTFYHPNNELFSLTPDLNFEESDFYETSSLLNFNVNSSEDSCSHNNSYDAEIEEDNFLTSRSISSNSFSINNDTERFGMRVRTNILQMSTASLNRIPPKSPNCETKKQLLSDRQKQLSNFSLKYLSNVDLSSKIPSTRNESHMNRTKHVRFSSSVKDSIGEEVSEDSNHKSEAEKSERHLPDRGDFPLAVKMVFNYEAASNAPAILSALYRELIPARTIQLDEVYENWRTNMFGLEALTDDDPSIFTTILGKFGSFPGHQKTNDKSLMPPHPNVVDMPCVFVDRIPELPQGMSLYPNALPPRINPEGFGRNMSLFCVMRRYDMPLDAYLASVGRRPSTRCSLLLLSQLLEALNHLSANGVAHRDIKPDNILLLLSGEGEEVPWLVLTDFGCCLATAPGASLSAPFPARSADPRQGNMALMAPEVKTARPGMLKTIDFSSCDLWAAGTIAYQLFGNPNPFIRTDPTQSPLDSATYKESQLPQLEGAPPAVAQLVRHLLRRKPANRPSVEVASTLCQMVLWAPQAWVLSSRPESGLWRCRRRSHRRLLEWLMGLTSKLIYEKKASPGPPSLEYLLVSVFLSRVRYAHVLEAIAWSRRCG